MSRYFLLLMLAVSLSWGACKSREFDYKRLSDKVRLSTGSYSMVAQLSHHLRGRLNKNRFYSWYDKGILDSTQGGYSGKLLDGIYTASYLDSKQLYSQGNYDMGLKTGYWKRWDAKGRLQEIQRWRGGKVVAVKPKRSLKQRLLKMVPFKRKVKP